MRLNQCVDDAFQEKFDTDSNLAALVNKVSDVVKNADGCYNVRCTAHSTCKRGKCVCDDGYVMDKHRCIPNDYVDSSVCPAHETYGQCQTWYDGCNTCQCNADGTLGACTMRF